jgi:hypothetical protein
MNEKQKLITNESLDSHIIEKIESSSSNSEGDPIRSELKVSLNPEEDLTNGDYTQQAQIDAEKSRKRKLRETKET